jgi:hypothetical protein
VNYEDLPPELRRQVDAKVGRPGRARTTKRALRVPSSPGRCWCGETFERYEDWERSHCGPGHRIWCAQLPISTA